MPFEDQSIIILKIAFHGYYHKLLLPRQALHVWWKLFLKAILFWVDNIMFSKKIYKPGIYKFFNNLRKTRQD